MSQDERPRVAVVTPHSGRLTLGWHYSVTKAVTDHGLVHYVKEGQSDTSILTKSHNECLALCLDLRDAGEITHMAMVHSDVAAQPGWVDILWKEMFAAGAHLVAGVIRIKHPGGRTSTAVGDLHDRWKVKRCVWMRDRKTMPPTFGAASVCGEDEVFLVNTGLFLADLRQPFWDTFAFNIVDRVRKTPAGRVAESRSEDWEMSHDLHHAGLKVMATWKVKARHEGPYKFPNYDDPTDFAPAPAAVG